MKNKYVRKNISSYFKKFKISMKEKINSTYFSIFFGYLWWIKWWYYGQQRNWCKTFCCCFTVLNACEGFRFILLYLLSDLLCLPQLIYLIFLPSGDESLQVVLLEVISFPHHYIRQQQRWVISQYNYSQYCKHQ